MRWFFGGTTGYSFVDVWTIAHLCFWVYIGSATWSLRFPRPIMLLCCLFMAFVWEVFERFAERRWPHLWLNQESWWNAWVSDPLTCVIGVLFMWYALDHWRNP